MIRTLNTCLVVVAVAGALALGLSGGGSTIAQDATAEATVAAPEPTMTPTAYPFRSLAFNLLGQADITVDADGPVAVSAASIALTAGAATVPFVAEGPTVIAFQAGEVTITADNALVGVTDIVSVIGLEVPVGTPAAAEEVTVSLGMQVYLPAGAMATLRNDTDKPASIIILTVVPSGPSVTPVP